MFAGELPRLTPEEDFRINFTNGCQPERAQKGTVFRVLESLALGGGS